MYVTFSYVPGFDNNIAMDIKPCQHVLDNKIFLWENLYLLFTLMTL